MAARARQKNPKFLWFIIFLLGFTLILNVVFQQKSRTETITQSHFVEKYQAGDIRTITKNGNTLTLELQSGDMERVVVEANVSLADLGVDSQKVEIEVIDQEAGRFWIDLLLGAIPFVIIGVFLLFMLRSAQGSNNNAMSFGKSKARLYEGGQKKITFGDVAGAAEAKEELSEVVDFLKSPKKYSDMGAKIPRGVMLFGSPGTGKTLMARAVAGEAGVPFFSISGSEFVEMFVGVGASRVRDLFNKAKKNAPSIIFIDEIDAVGRQRGAGLGGGHDEREQTLNQILTEMDGFDKDTGVIIMAATNRPDVLDPALLRPGRFDRRVVVDMPDQKAREEILEVHAKDKKLDKDVDFSRIAQLCIGFSGAELENLMNESAIYAAKNNMKKITHKVIDQSIEKVMMGPEKRSRKMSTKELEVTAYHEVGHAIVATKLENCDPVQKVSIVARGQALGVTWFLPEEDSHLRTRDKFVDDMASMLGGYAAEQFFYGVVSTGPSNDLERASKMARSMVLRFGMSEKLGPVTFGEEGHAVFLGKDLAEGRDYSEATAHVIDQEVQSLVSDALKTALTIIKANKAKMKKVSDYLLEHETISGEDFRDMVS